MTQWLLSLTTTAAPAATDAPKQPSMTDGLLQMGIIIVPMILVFYFLIIRPEKKRKKQRVEMLNQLIVGDTITTSGGIVGRVIQIKDDSVVIETGTDRTKLTVMRWAIADKGQQITDQTR